MYDILTCLSCMYRIRYDPTKIIYEMELTKQLTLGQLDDAL